jgi:uncharacterized delta-60 repeat protein
MRLSLVLCSLGLTLACTPIVTPVDGGPNLLDPAFGTQGSVQTRFSCGSSARANAVVAVGNGRVVAGGRGCNGWALAGFLDNGAPDPAFGDGGTALLFPDGGEFFEVLSLLARPDGALIARGDVSTQHRVRQFSASGAVDAPFALAIDQALGSRFTSVQAMALQADGKLLIAKGTELTRVGIDGTLDLTFGTAGVVTVSLFGAETFLTDLLVRPDGRLVLSGLDASGSNPWGEPFVAQLSAGGAFDPSFGTAGIVRLKPAVGGFNSVGVAALQPDGKLLLAGWVKASSLGRTRPAVWRLTPAGVLDASFGASGEAEGPAGAGNAQVNALAVLPDGKILAAGSYQQTTDLQDSWQLVRFTPSGELDATFGESGFPLFDLGTRYSPGGAASVAVTPAGYVVAGRMFSANEPAAFVLARILP